MAKHLIALGVRRDPAAIIGPAAGAALHAVSPYAGDRSNDGTSVMTPVLVTGGSGFIGQHLVSELVARGRQVRVLDVCAPARTLPAVEYIKGSVLDTRVVDDAAAGVGEISHLAGLPGMWKLDRTEFHDVNFIGTRNVLAAARRRDVGRFLHCSTESIFFNASRPAQ